MKDDAIRRRPVERDALVEAGVRAFCLTNAQLRAAEQTERFVSNRHRIIQQARKLGHTSSASTTAGSGASGRLSNVATDAGD